MEASEEQDLLLLAFENFRWLKFTSTIVRLCLGASATSIEASIASTASVDSSIATSLAEENGRFHGSFHGRFHGSILFEASTTSIGNCFASVEASRSLHSFRGSFHLYRNSFPCAMGASVGAMEAFMEAMERFDILWDGKLPRMFPVDASVEPSASTSVEASSSTSAESSKELRLLPRAFTWFHLRPLTSTSSHEL